MITIIVVLCDYTCREAGQCNDTAEVGVVSSSGFDEGAKMSFDLRIRHFGTLQNYTEAMYSQNWWEFKHSPPQTHVAIEC